MTDPGGAIALRRPTLCFMFHASRRLQCLTLCVFFVAACDADSAEDSEPAAAEKKGAKKDDAPAKDDARPKGKAEGPDPCALLSKEDLVRVAKVPADVEVSIGTGKFMKELCEYQWKLPGEQKLFSTKVGVAIPKRPLPDAKSAKAAYTRSLEELAKAMTTNGKPPELETIEGVGDEASWYASMKQLSVRKDDALFHISISQSKDDKPAALALAKSLADAVIKAR